MEQFAIAYALVLYAWIGASVATLLLSIAAFVWVRRMLVFTPLVAVTTLLLVEIPPRPLWWIAAISLWALISWPRLERPVHARRPSAFVGVALTTLGTSLIVFGAWRWIDAGGPWLFRTAAPRAAERAESPRAPRVRAQPSAPARIPAPRLSRQRVPQTGLTFVVLDGFTENGRRYVKLGVDESSNPYAGDTSIAETLPILAIRGSDVPKPDRVGRVHWSKATVDATQPIRGTELTSLEQADRIVREQLGEEWRMASFHEASGWRFWAAGELPEDSTRRYWVRIRDQLANPWDD